jgi:hypothetical protein
MFRTCCCILAWIGCTLALLGHACEAMRLHQMYPAYGYSLPVLQEALGSMMLFGFLAGCFGILSAVSFWEWNRTGQTDNHRNLPEGYWDDGYRY